MRKYLCIFTAAVLLATPFVVLPVAPAEAASVTVDTTNDVADGDTSSIANLITDPGTDGFISLREAIEAANNTPGTDAIEFTIDHTTDPGCDVGTGVCTIQPLEVLPALTDNGTTIDGYTQGDAAPASGSIPAKLRIVLDGSSAPGTANGLIASGSGDHLIKGLAIHSFPQNGIYIHGTLATNVTVEGCYIGTDHLGATALPNTLDGVHITLSANVNVIGGITAAARNVISGNGGDGVDINTSANENMVMGNYIGTDASGLLGRGNGGSGIMIQSGAQANLAGGATIGAGNVISANGGDGITLRHAATNDNDVQGNLIGLAADGAADLGNGGNGIQILLGAYSNSIGGPIAVTRNIISGNASSGVLIWDAGSDWNEVVGNYIGTNAAGTGAVPNDANGVFITGNAYSNTIGGDDAGERNLISGNGIYGVSLSSSYNTVSGNYIGTHASGYSSLPNQYGVYINNATDNVVGGSTPGARNLISGNVIGGVQISGTSATANEVIGNDIGVDASGDGALGNGTYGVNLVSGAHGNTIGSATTGEYNQISGNDYGVYISGADTDLNVVAGNRIGTNGAGDLAVPNFVGIQIMAGAQDNTIGGSSPGEGNLISGNTGDGVFLKGENTDGNAICGNMIGLNLAGNAALANGGNGIWIYQGPEFNVIGGSTTGCRNVISGNASDGVRITGATTSGNIVSGNYIGLDAAGSLDRGNGLNGVTISTGSSDNVVGGETDAGRNIISGNDQNGIEIGGTATNGNRVIGNYIGTDSTGLSDIGNQSDGIKLSPSMMNAEIGGDTPGERNVISGNGSMGIRLTGVNILGTAISGNYIGVDQTGMTALPNDGYGIYLNYGPQSTVIGGDLPAEGNIISGNQFGGVVLNGTATTGNTLKGNLIGVGAGGQIPIPNGGDGVQVLSNAIDNTLGPANVIWYNAGDGISVDSAYHVTITQNSIYLNEVKGINLVGSANEGIPAPAITQTSPGSLYVEGIGAPYDGMIELFSSPNSDGEGKTYLGSTTADFDGMWSITVPCVSDRYLTATGTDLAGNTSEFSLPFTSTVGCLYLPLIMR